MNNNRLVKIILENAPEVLKAQKSLHLCSKSPRVSIAENPRVLFSFNPHLHGPWDYMILTALNGHFLCTKIVKQFVFLVQRIVFIHKFLNL